MSAFEDWIKQKYFEYQQAQNRVVSVRKFATYIGVKQQTMSKWILGKSKPTDEGSIARLATIFGSEVYDILEIEPPDNRLLQLIQNWPSLTEEAKKRILEVVGIGAGDKGNGAKTKSRRKTKNSR